MDARVVLLSLTDKMLKQFARIASREEALNQFIFEDLDGPTLQSLTDTLEALDRRHAKSPLKLQAGL